MDQFVMKGIFVVFTERLLFTRGMGVDQKRLA